MPVQAKTVAIFTARPGKSDEVRNLLLGMLRPSRKEAGNLRWDLWRDPAAETRFVVDELYVDAGAVMIHRETPHYKTYAEAMQSAADRVAVTVEPVEVG